MADVNAPGPQAPKRSGKQRSLLRELPFLIGIALVLALLIKTFLVQAFFIPSESMEKTLLIGDRVMVNKIDVRLGGHVHRGEVVVFRDPGGWLGEVPPTPAGNVISRSIRDVFVFFGLMPSAEQGDLIKRVIGVGGDRVRCCDEKGRVTVNGVGLDEPYVFPGNQPSITTFDVTVPKGRLWVMGDHRAVSRDSSKHLDDPGQGTIPADHVVGRAFVRLWPLGRMGGLGVPATFHRKELNAVGGAAPVLLGLTGALPVTVCRRRRRRRGAEVQASRPGSGAAAA